ncbi:hypothetical protein [Planctomicrobium sp. SH664]|uniref:hypothetical protein n=1 Tax=Planctomicrobium sp. SH664 TaxID=3448125 RepID=UPI003F5B4C12
MAASTMKWLPWVAVVVHAALVGAVIRVVQADAGNGESAAFWNLFLLVDFPAGILALSVAPSITEWATALLGTRLPKAAGKYEIEYLCVVPALILLFGSLQWFFLLRFIVSRWRSRA